LSLQVSALAGKQPHECQFVVSVGLYSKFAPEVAVRDDALIELGDLERVRQVVRILSARAFDEKDEEPIEIVHGFAEMRSVRYSHSCASAEADAGRPSMQLPTRWPDDVSLHHGAPHHIQYQ
jgi:hypothetical protein